MATYKQDGPVRPGRREEIDLIAALESADPAVREAADSFMDGLASILARQAIWAAEEERRKAPRPTAEPGPSNLRLEEGL